jgi:excisionase family DNA binding protein
MLETSTPTPLRKDQPVKVDEEAPEYLTAQEVADKLRTSVEWVRDKCASGALRAIKIGKAYRIRTDDLARFTSPPEEFDPEDP